MKKLVAITLLFSFLCSNTEVHELFKLQHLVLHYYEHASKEKDASLADFLHVHYSHDHKNHNDDHHDKGCLPFQGDHSCQINALNFIASGTPVEFKPNMYLKNLEQKQIPSDFILSDFCSKIWQPPKLV